MAELLDAHLIEDALTNLPDWAGGQDRLTRTATLTDAEHREVTERIAVTADAMDHHPDVERSGEETRFTLSTHSDGGVTAKDIALASEIDTVTRQVRGEPPLPAPDEVISSHAVSASRDEGHEGPSAAGEHGAATEFMGVPAGAQGTPQVPLPDAAPGKPEPGNAREQDPDRDLS